MKKSEYKAFKEVVTMYELNYRKKFSDNRRIVYSMNATIFIITNDKRNIPDANRERRIIPFPCKKDKRKEYDNAHPISHLHRMIMGYGYNLF